VVGLVDSQNDVTKKGIFRRILPGWPKNATSLECMRRSAEGESTSAPRRVDGQVGAAASWRQEWTVVEPYAVAVSKRSEVRKSAQEPQQGVREDNPW